ncbi:methyltransferase family protein [Nocardioides sp. SLBN-35]|nr:methyltransferase family protein [Nocardioides sp. SLBN-35]
MLPDMSIENGSRPRTKRDAGPEAQREAMAKRRAQFLAYFDFTQGRGLEIGPLDSSIADPESHDVRFVDVFDTERTRAHYAEDPNVVLELIPTIDFPLYADGQFRALPEATAAGAPFDWVIASHVIEHVPDVIGWLQQIGEITSDDARLVLAVPDRRYCFDRHRPPTTTGQALEAHEQQATRPGTRAIYDFFRTTVSVDSRRLWRGARPPGRDARMHELSTTLAHVDLGRAGEYIDCHVWTFTPQSLLEQVQEWRELGLAPWYVERIDEVKGSVEFHAVLRRASRTGDSAAAEAAEPQLASDLPDWLEEEYRLRAEVSELRAQLKQLRNSNKQLTHRLKQAEVPVATRIRRGTLRRVRALRSSN